jgi:hypothetical protein
MSQIIVTYTSSKIESIIRDRMVCVEYMKNFYNWEHFNSGVYSHFLTDVLRMCNQMIMTTYTKKTEILNEVLELYRLIVEKYACGIQFQENML